MKKLQLFMLISFLTNMVWAQKQGNIWYFGNNAGISFNTSTPTALTDGQISRREGCATISDKNGNLLFYTDGQNVYDNTHSVMPNGSGLLGNGSSCQSAIIFPWPDSSYKYFVVSVDAIENNAANGVRYSVVDLRLNNGKGDVITTSKNVVLIKPQCEKVTLVQHSNKKDFWLVTNQSSSDSMLSFAVTTAGINKKAVRSNTGVNLSSDLNNNLGYITPSHDGTKLVTCHFQMNIFLLMDFDNQTGKISNVKTFPKASAYCAEFSPNNKVLYVSGLRSPTSIDQFDISSNSQTTIINSMKQIFDYGSGEMGALKLGPDGRIYATSETTSNGYNTYLGAIRYPNTLDTNCSFTPKAIYLSGKGARLGLPNNYAYSQHPSDIKHIGGVSNQILKIYPSPANSIINIECPSKSANSVLKIINSLGQVVVCSALTEISNLQIGRFELNVADLPDGIYYVLLHSGTSEFTGKFVMRK